MSASTVSNSTAKTIPPVTASTFVFSNITTGTANKFDDYGFTKYKIGYPRPDSTDDKCVIKLSNLEVLGVYPPKNNEDGTPPKNPKYSVVMATTDPDQVKFFEGLNATVKQLAYKNRTTWFTGGEELTAEDIESDMMYPKSFGALVPNENPAKYKFTVSFPFNNTEIVDPVSVHYYDPDVSQDVINSTDLMDKIARHSVVDIFLRITNICVKTNNEYSCQATVHKRINVHKFTRGGASNGPTKGLTCDNVDVKKIIMGSVETNEKYSSRHLAPKYTFVGPDGKEGKPRNLIITLPDVKCMFRKSTKVDDKTKKVSINYDVVYNLNPEHLAKFKEIDDYIKQDLITNYSTYEPGKRTNAKLFDPKFKPAVSDGKDKNGELKYSPSIWVGVYYKTKEDGTPDFGGNFYKPNPAYQGDDSVPKYVNYTDEEVESSVFGKSHKCTLSVYLKHVWFGAKYSIKYNMTNAILSTDAVNFDYGDVHVDRQTGADLDQADE